MHTDAEAIFRDLDLWLHERLTESEAGDSELCSTTLRRCREELWQARERRSLMIIRQASSDRVTPAVPIDPKVIEELSQSAAEASEVPTVDD